MTTTNSTKNMYEGTVPQRDPKAGNPHVYRNCSSVSLHDSKGAGHFE